MCSIDAEQTIEDLVDRALKLGYVLPMSYKVGIYSN